MAEGASIAIKGATIYARVDASPLESANLVIRHGRVESLGPGVELPPDVPTLSAEGAVITPGFWNCHVHFTEAKWRSAGRSPADRLNMHLREMLTRRGFTTVVDTGSDPRSTIPLRQRIRSGELEGPAILTACSGFFPPRGIPYYLKESIPFWLRPFVPAPSSPRAARRAVRANIARGADLCKIFTGSYIARGRVKPMPEAIARAAVEEAHSHQQLVFSHPSNLEGVRIAVRSGVDVLAHPPDTADGVDDEAIRQIVARRMGMIPTLGMFATVVSRSDSYLQPIYDVVRRFHRAGGQLLFGTDVGFTTEYETVGEFRAMASAGLDYRAILRALTAAPAERFGMGTVGLAPGAPGDIVLLDGDPSSDVEAFSRVRATIRSGRVIYSSGR